VGYHARGGRHASRMAAVRRMAIDKSDIARGLQSKCHGWLVMWSKWRQTYTAFSCMTEHPVIIDDADFDRFLDRIKQASTRALAG
jgi:NADH:ubiquinone oxidoreductase subunit B-like Fe-S oxidoreductase